MKTQRKMFMVLFVITVLVIFAAAIAAIPAQAMGAKMPLADEPVTGITSSALFSWLLGSGGLILILSWLVERWAWYQAQNPDWKKVLFILGVVVLGSVVHALQLYVPAAIWALIDPWFQFISGLVILGAGAMGLHQLTKPEA